MIHAGLFTRVRLTFRLILLAVIVAAAALAARAERLPIKIYTAVDGLANNRVHRIARDSRGFIWFCTTEGLSRFDGYSFVNYTTDDGLPFHSINDLLEDADGDYWVASNGVGVIRFTPKTSAPGAAAQARFVVYAVGDKPVSNRVNLLRDDRQGRIWAATDGGLYRLDKRRGEVKFQRVELGLGAHADEAVQVWALFEDRDSSLWIGTKFGLVRRLPDGRMIHYSVRPSPSSDTVHALLWDQNDRLWIGHRTGLVVVNPKALPLADSALGAPLALNAKAGSRDPYLIAERQRYAALDGLNGSPVFALLQASDGTIWVGSSTRGLFQFSEGRLQNYAAAQGLAGKDIRTLTEDGQSSLWLGTEDDGAARIYRNGFTLYGEADGLGPVISSIIKTPASDFYVTGGDYRLSRFDGKRFITARLNVGQRVGRWHRYPNVIEDRAGEWWVATVEGLYRFAKVSGVQQLTRARPKAIYTTREGLAGNDLTALFEDSRGDIWIGNFAPNRESLTRWERATGTFHRYGADDGLPAFNMTIAFCEDRAGDIWIGLFAGGLARYRAGRFMTVTPADGLPVGTTHDLHLDRAGRLWATTDQGGLVRIEDPAADHPRLKVYTTADGLSSNGVRCVTEDAQGRIYVASSHAIDRLDPATGQIKHYHLTEELDVSELAAAFCDRQGALWFAAPKNLTRLLPESNRSAPPPPILIGGLRVAGVERAVSDLGEREIAGLELAAGQNQVQVDFFGIAFGSGGALRYQYQLEGLDPDWNAPTSQRTMSYGSLAPGRYRFLVRAIAADGTLSESPASVSFYVPPPVWQRWWFGLTALMLIAAPIVAIARYRHQRTKAVREAQAALRRSREERLVELEQVRRRIATDLHDDIGTSLSQIYLLSEVVRQRIDRNNEAVAEPLTMISSATHEVVSSMSDIVWAINPQKDHLSDLIHRMRRFASDTFGTRDIAFRFSAPDDGADIRLGANLRREVFLIFKESVNNLVKHSGCTEAGVEFQVTDNALLLRVSDNGCGFDPSTDSDGHGLLSMRERAGSINGQYELASKPGGGTTVTLRIQLPQAATFTTTIGGNGAG